ncbi:hypothetical protein A6R68_02109, partial [Neotoma lepida]
MEKAKTHLKALLPKTIHDIMEELMTTFHAIIITQKIIYSPSGKLWHDDQKAAQNIIPVSKIVDKADLICLIEKATNYDDINEAIKQTSSDPLKGIMHYTKTT